MCRFRAPLPQTQAPGKVAGSFLEATEPPLSTTTPPPPPGAEPHAHTSTDTHADQRYFPPAGEAQLTARAVIVGCLVGGVVSCTNIYIGLRIGWSFGASIISAVLGFAFFSMLGKRLSVLETNITQTAGSAAGSMASSGGLIAAIPAMQMLGYEFTWYQLIGWGAAIAFLGVFFAVPLRRQVVEIDRLRFPTGTATCETVLAMYGDEDGGGSKEAIAKAKVLLWAGAAAGLLSLTQYFIEPLENPPLHEWIGWTALGTASAWGFSLFLGPALFGAGFLIGPVWPPRSCWARCSRGPCWDQLPRT